MELKFFFIHLGVASLLLLWGLFYLKNTKERMLLIAAYFLLFWGIMPQFVDADKIYRIALYLNEQKEINWLHLFIFYAVIFAAFISGFVLMRRKIKSITEA